MFTNNFEQAIVYMLKVMKRGIETTKFKEEFEAIRHGDYDTFAFLVKAEKRLLVAYKDGVISNQDHVSQKTHGDFVGLMVAEPSLVKFFNKCVDEYGKDILENDSDIKNAVYRRIALFEPSIRMHANNNKLLNGNEKFHEIINKLSSCAGLSTEDTEKLHLGRHLLNDIKHHNDKRHKRKFSSWEEGASKFEGAYKILVDKGLTIV